MQLPSLIIPLRYSPALCVAVLATHLLPLLLVWLIYLPGPVAVGVTLLVLLSAAQHGYMAYRRKAWRLLLHAAGHAQLQHSLPEPPEDICLLEQSRDLGWLIVVCWQPQAGGRVQRFALCRDGMPADAWRKLRVSLRWRRLEKTL